MQTEFEVCPCCGKLKLLKGMKIEDVGFKLKERKYRKLESTSFWIKNATKKFYLKHKEQVTGAPFSEYEDILVFEKGGSN